MNNNRHSQAGFTLVEIMVALIIGLFLTIGVTQVFTSTKGTNRVQESLSRMQENARFAMHFISTDIRQAGYDGAVCGESEILKTAYNNLDSSDAQYLFDDIVAVDGEDNVGVNGSDRITVNRFNSLGPGIPIVAPFNTGTSLHIDPVNAGGLTQGDIVLVTDCARSDVFQIVNDPSLGTLTHSVAAGGITPGNKTNNLVTVTLVGDYSATARLYLLSPGAGRVAVTYDVSNDGNGVPGLRVGSVAGVGGNQLISNIENMQILYGQRLGGGETYYVPAGTASLAMEQVVSVRISLLARSPDDFVATSPQTFFYDFDGTSTAATDRRLRKVYTSTLTIRNRLN